MENRVVITGMGIWSCIGQDLQTVTESLKQGRSGIIFDPQRIEYGLHSGLTGNVPSAPFQWRSSGITNGFAFSAFNMPDALNVNSARQRMRILFRIGIYVCLNQLFNQEERTGNFHSLLLCMYMSGISLPGRCGSVAQGLGRVGRGKKWTCFRTLCRPGG